MALLAGGGGGRARGGPPYRVLPKNFQLHIVWYKIIVINMSESADNSHWAQVVILGVGVGRKRRGRSGWRLALLCEVVYGVWASRCCDWLGWWAGNIDLGMGTSGWVNRWEYVGGAD